MKPKFSPSINVLRDEGEDFGYIPTENAKRIAQEILQSERTGTHAFQVIGSYGTGKSAFLLALTNTLLGKAQHFPFKAAKRPPGVINLTGEYSSLIGHWPTTSRSSGTRRISGRCWMRSMNAMSSMAGSS